MTDGRLVRVAPAPDAAVDPLAVLIHDQFRGMTLSHAFPCLGGAGTVRRGDYRFGLYPTLASSDAVRRCAADVTAFAAELPSAERPYGAFVAAFDGPVYASEIEFETGLFEHLAGMREADGATPSREAVAASMKDKDDVAFIFAGRNYYVVGFHPAASRWSRRFGWPLLVFNDLAFVEPLRESGKLECAHKRIMARDHRLQGSHNPSLSVIPQTAGFSGRAVETGWECPQRLD